MTSATPGRSTRASPTLNGFASSPAAAWLTSTDSTSTAMTLRHRSKVTSENGAVAEMPALLTTTSIRPNVSRVVATAAWTAA
jgi:hypothetical protein